jgi:twitching motility protein PilT
MDQTLLGQILLNFNLLNEQQLQHYISLQSRQYPPQLLGEILVEEGVVDAAALESILSVQKRKLALEKGPTRLTKDEIQQRLQTGEPEQYLRILRELGGTDLYLSSGARPAVRLHGSLVDLPAPPLTLDQAKNLLFPLLHPEQIEVYHRQKSIDECLEVEGVGRFRFNVFRHYQGLAGVIRSIADRVLPLDQLGLPSSVRNFSKWSKGLVLVTGPTASGKSTTLAALIQLINQNRKQHIVTIEDPIEIVHQSDQALVTQRQVNAHTESPSAALHAALREDPDIIVVGELRDPEMAATALTAAETGHLVFATLHTASAYRTVLRLIDQFPARKRSHVRTMLATVLRGVVCQQLLPNLDRQRRSLACEVLVVNSAVSNLIREDRLWQIPMVMQMGASEGMQLMDDSLQQLVSDKKISLEDAIRLASEPDRFLQPQ